MMMYVLSQQTSPVLEDSPQAGGWLHLDNATRHVRPREEVGWKLATLECSHSHSRIPLGFFIFNSAHTSLCDKKIKKNNEQQAGG